MEAACLKSNDNYTTFIAEKWKKAFGHPVFKRNGRNTGAAFIYPCAPFLFGKSQ